MEQNTNRMWWTIGLIVLGGLLISGFVVIANTNVIPRISEKANALIKKTDPDVTHTAYSWSSDGTDRFTTTKPNLNLLKGTRTPSSLTGDNIFNQVTTAYSFDNGKSVQYQGLSVGNTLTCEFDWTVSNPTSGLFYVQLNGTNWQRLSQNISITSENQSGHSKFSFVVDASFLAGVATATRLRADYLPTNSMVTLSNVVFTKGSVATPWMPSASEVKPSDQPKYMGTYTDKNEVASQDPAKYTWKLAE